MMPVECVQDLEDVVEVLLGGLREYDDVVEVHHRELGEERTQHRFHHALEGRRCVAETHGHHQKLVRADRCAYRCFPDVLPVHVHLPVAEDEVDAGHDLGLVQLQHVEEVLVPRQIVGVFDGLGVQGSVVDDEPETTVRLGDEHDGRAVRR